MQDRIISLLGLATKAGKTCSGSFSVEKAIKDHSARLVILSKDASDNTKKHFTDMCKYRNIPVFIYGTSDELGKGTGNESRITIAVLDNGFANKLRSMITEVKI